MDIIEQSKKEFEEREEINSIYSLIQRVNTLHRISENCTKRIERNEKKLRLLGDSYVVIWDHSGNYRIFDGTEEEADPEFIKDSREYLKNKYTDENSECDSLIHACQCEIDTLNNMLFKDK